MNKKATAIYNQQNKVIHRALRDIDMPYEENKEELLALFTGIIGHKINGLSDLTLGERNQIIRYYQKKGLRLFKPFIGKDIRDWRKGDAEIDSLKTARPLNVPTDKKRMINKIWAILTDMDLSWEYADGISKNMFGIGIVEWCSPDQLHKVVAAMVINQRRRYA